MGNNTRNQLKNLVTINAAIEEAGEEIQMVQKEMNIHVGLSPHCSALV